MIKRTLYFGNPAYLSLKLSQLVINTPHDVDGKSKVLKTIPIEDIAIVVLDNKQITITQALMEALLDAEVSLITCSASHHPTGLMLPLCGHTLQSERFARQIAASLPLKKQIWQQTMQSKIANQAAVLEFTTQEKHPNMLQWSRAVRSGDPDNLEARAAAYYWKNVFRGLIDNFTRGRDEESPNDLLNYGYALLRATVARSLVCSGLLPTLGVHHHNRYNAYCLADDIMEPYRPIVDKYIYTLVSEEKSALFLSQDNKIRLLEIPSLDVKINGSTSPLMIATTITTASLAKCFNGETRQVIYPVL